MLIRAEGSTKQPSCFCNVHNMMPDDSVSYCSEMQYLEWKIILVNWVWLAPIIFVAVMAGCRMQWLLQHSGASQFYSGEGWIRHWRGQKAQRDDRRHSNKKVWKAKSGGCWKVKKVKERIVLSEIHLRTTGRHLSMGPHSVICHPTEVTALPSPQPDRLVLDLSTP